VTVATPLPQADLAVAQSDSPDPVVGANTVEYTVTVSNNGPAASGPVTVSDSLPSGGSITSISGSGWTCSGGGTSAGCTGPSLASGARAPAIRVLVLAPNSNTTIVNRASVSQSGASDPVASNSTADQSTSVVTDATCPTGFISCGQGQIVYGLLSQVTTGSTVTLQRYHVGTTTFNGVAGAVGGQIWSMQAPKVPGNFCPTNLLDTAVTQCSWQMDMQPIPAVYPVGSVTFVGLCYVARCPQNPLLPGAGTIVVKVKDDGSHVIFPPCNGGTNECFEQARVAGGHLRITVRNLIAGDPKIAGICVGGGC
jgi:uncharacterized repeat protein (TIGR01451 family)